MLLINRKNIALKSLVLFAAFAVMSSFSAPFGGDSYRVYVNNKLVLEEFVHMQKSVKNISLNHQAVNDQVSVYYSHCGKVGQARHITIRDGKNKILRDWTFADVKGSDAPMTCSAKDILALQKTGGDRLGLHYSSKEMPKGRMLATVNIVKDNLSTP